MNQGFHTTVRLQVALVLDIRLLYIVHYRPLESRDITVNNEVCIIFFDSFRWRSSEHDCIVPLGRSF